jgi:hypothetical protein
MWKVPWEKGVEGGPASVMCHLWMSDSERRETFVRAGGRAVRSASS